MQTSSWFRVIRSPTRFKSDWRTNTGRFLTDSFFGLILFIVLLQVWCTNQVAFGQTEVEKSAANEFFSNAMEELRAGNIDERIELFLLGLEIWPDEPRANYYLAEAYRRRGEGPELQMKHYSRSAEHGANTKEGIMAKARLERMEKQILELTEKEMEEKKKKKMKTKNQKFENWDLARLFFEKYGPTFCLGHTFREFKSGRGQFLRFTHRSISLDFLVTARFEQFFLNSYGNLVPKGPCASLGLLEGFSKHQSVVLECANGTYEISSTDYEQDRFVSLFEYPPKPGFSKMKLHNSATNSDKNCG